MAVTNTINLHMELAGLGEQELIPLTMSTTTTITAKQHGYQTQATADTAEALDMGGVTTAELIILKCITNDVDIDTSFDTSFSAEIAVAEGEFTAFKPEGVVYLKNGDAGEASIVEYWILGV